MEKEKYWYYTTVFYCPICSKEERHRERMYTKKPEDVNLLGEWEEVYDYCDAL